MSANGDTSSDNTLLPDTKAGSSSPSSQPVRSNASPGPTAARRLSTTSSLLLDAQRARSAPPSAGAGAKKRTSIFGFLTLKDPSTTAIQQAAKAHKKQLNTSTNRPSTANSTQQLPPDVPKVNSKWDGLPSSAVAARSRSQLTLSRSSMTSSSTQSSGSQPSSRHSRRHTRERSKSTPKSHSMQAIITGTTPVASKHSTPRGSLVADRQDSLTALSPIVPPEPTPFAAPGPITRGLGIFKEVDGKKHDALPTADTTAVSTKPDSVLAGSDCIAASTSSVHFSDDFTATDIDSKPPSHGRLKALVGSKSTEWSDLDKRLSKLGGVSPGTSLMAGHQHSTPQSLSSSSSGSRAALDTPPSSVSVSPPCNPMSPDKAAKPSSKPNPARLSGPFGIESIDSRPIVGSASAIVGLARDVVPAVPTPQIEHVGERTRGQLIGSDGHASASADTKATKSRRINFSKPFARRTAEAATVAHMPQSGLRSSLAVDQSPGHERVGSDDSTTSSQPSYALCSGAAQPRPPGDGCGNDMVPGHRTAAELRKSRRLTAESQTLSLRPTIDGPMSSLPAW